MELHDFACEIKEELMNTRLGELEGDVDTPERVVCEGECIEVNKYGERYIAEYVFYHESEIMVWNGEETPEKIRELNKFLSGRNYGVTVKTNRLKLKGRVSGFSIVERMTMMIEEQVRREKNPDDYRISTKVCFE